MGGVKFPKQTRLIGVVNISRTDTQPITRKGAGIPQKLVIILVRKLARKARISAISRKRSQSLTKTSSLSFGVGTRIKSSVSFLCFKISPPKSAKERIFVVNDGKLPREWRGGTCLPHRTKH